MTNDLKRCLCLIKQLKDQGMKMREIPRFLLFAHDIQVMILDTHDNPITIGMLIRNKDILSAMDSDDKTMCLREFDVKVPELI